MTLPGVVAGQGEEPYLLARRIVFHVIDAGLGPGDRVDPCAAGSDCDDANPRLLTASIEILRQIGFLDPDRGEPDHLVTLTSDVHRFHAVLTLGQIARLA